MVAVALSTPPALIAIVGHDLRTAPDERRWLVSRGAVQSNNWTVHRRDNATLTITTDGPTDVPSYEECWGPVVSAAVLDTPT